MRRKMFLMLPFLLVFWALQAQRSPEDVGKQIVEALQKNDFQLMQSMSPDQDLVAQLMQSNSPNKGESPNGSIQPATAYKMMQDKMRNEFDDLLKSAKFHKVKLKFLSFEKIESEEENPEAQVPMKALQMIMKAKSKRFRLAYTVIGAGDNWYYTGTLLSVDAFRPIEN